MEIEKMLISNISKRISRLYENQSAILNAHLEGKETISDNVVSTLKNGKIYNKNYLTKGQIERLEDIFEVSRGDIFFGNNLEIEGLVKKFYYKVAYNFNIDEESSWNEYVYFDEKLDAISNYYYELTFFSARLAFLWSIIEMENPKIEKRIPIFDLDETHRQQYDLIVEFIWRKNKNDFIASFKERFVNNEKLLFKDIEIGILSWLEYNFKSILKQFKKKELRSNNTLNIGYQVRKILLIAKNEISKNIKELEEQEEIPEGLYEDLYDKWYPIKFETTQSYTMMQEPDVDTPAIIPFDKALEQFEILLNIEKVYIDHAIALMRVQDNLIDIEGNDQIGFLVIPRVMRGK